MEDIKMPGSFFIAARSKIEDIELIYALLKPEEQIKVKTVVGNLRQALVEAEREVLGRVEEIGKDDYSSLREFCQKVRDDLDDKLCRAPESKINRYLDEIIKKKDKGLVDFFEEAKSKINKIELICYYFNSVKEITTGVGKLRKALNKAEQVKDDYSSLFSIFQQVRDDLDDKLYRAPESILKRSLAVLIEDWTDGEASDSIELDSKPGSFFRAAKSKIDDIKQIYDLSFMLKKKVYRKISSIKPKLIELRKAVNDADILGDVDVELEERLLVVCKQVLSELPASEIKQSLAVLLKSKEKGFIETRQEREKRLEQERQDKDALEKARQEGLLEGLRGGILASYSRQCVGASSVVHDQSKRDYCKRDVKCSIM